MSKKPIYPNDPIASSEALAKALKLSHQELIAISQNASSYYKPNKPEIKSSGGIRQHYTVAPKLKRVQSSILNNILLRVCYPDYLHGALKKRTPKSSAESHLKKKLLIKEDIACFFDSIQSSEVEKMWLRLFNFHPDVASLLTMLTTYRGIVPQGAPTSSYIANLILWDKEPDVVEELEEQGYKYTRFVDDITISTNNVNQSLTPAVSILYRMFFSKGLKPRRDKHEILLSGNRQEVQGIVTNNRKPSLNTDIRKGIRSEVRLLRLLNEKDHFSDDFRDRYRRCIGRLYWMKDFHPQLAEKYLNDLEEMRPRLSTTEKQRLNAEVMKLESHARRFGGVSRLSKSQVQNILDRYGMIEPSKVKPFRKRVSKIRIASD